jgi:hypothetical protein
MLCMGGLAIEKDSMLTNLSHPSKSSAQFTLTNVSPHTCRFPFLSNFNCSSCTDVIYLQRRPPSRHRMQSVVVIT